VTCSHPVTILVTTPTGFRWKKKYRSPPDKVTWTAKGVRATPEQVAELAKDLPLFGTEQQEVEDGGTIRYAAGEQGVVSFARPFALPPKVEIDSVIVTEITAGGFKWKHPGTKVGTVMVYPATWKARGVLDPAAGKKGAGK